MSKDLCRGDGRGLRMHQLYYQEKNSVTPDKPNGTLIHPSSQAHYRIDAIVKYIGQQFVDAVSATDKDTGVQYIASWEVHKGKCRERCG